MSDEKEKPETPGEQEPREEETPEVEKSETSTPAQDETAAPEGEKTEKDEKSSGKGKKESHKKEKTFTLTREQMEAAEKAAKQLESAKDQFVRLTAEYDNYRKRTTKEKESIYQDAKADTITEFLAVYDNLERALTTDAESESPHRKGMEMIFTQFKEILKKMGVTEMEAKGQPFDPNRHNAVMHIDDETLGENVVANVFQAGFMMGDKVLRFATVQVAN